MKKMCILRLVSLILCGVLIAALALSTMGCTDPKPPADTESPADTVPPTVKGEGATVFYFHVVDLEGKQAAFEIHTDKTLVGDALLELGLIAGEEGTYGLYVKTVNGVTIDPDKGRAYWAFYEGSRYANAGVDSTAVQPGASYTFKAEKG